MLTSITRSMNVSTRTLLQLTELRCCDPPGAGRMVPEMREERAAAGRVFPLLQDGDATAVSKRNWSAEFRGFIGNSRARRPKVLSKPPRR